jgi:hypothetical protein
VTAIAPTRVRQLITNPEHGLEMARRLAEGAIVAQGFGNFYVITTRGDAETVRRVNLMKGRPPAQVGSITGPPASIPSVWDLDKLPDGLSPQQALNLVDAFFSLGPFGFRGPAAVHVPAHLTFPEGSVRTAQVIAPGYACPSNVFLSHAARLCPDEPLYITSANRSRHLTGADDSPAHWRADGLAAEFGDEEGFMILEHEDEAAQARYPRYLPTSVTILGLHTVTRVLGDRRPQLVLDRHGSLHADDVRAVLADFGFGLVLGPKARTRLLLRDYSQQLSDR